MAKRKDRYMVLSLDDIKTLTTSLKRARQDAKADRKTPLWLGGPVETKIYELVEVKK